MVYISKLIHVPEKKRKMGCGTGELLNVWKSEGGSPLELDRNSCPRN